MGAGATPREAPHEALDYVPAHLLAGRPHVMVDGMPRPGTVCTLSHWPGTPTPPALWHDVSAGIVLRALEAGALPPEVRAASLDHYDEDGALSLALLCVAGLADRHAPLLLAAARVGDFGVVAPNPEGRRAALVAFALAAVGRQPTGDGDVMARGACHVTGALDLVPRLADDPASFEGLWGPEGRAYEASVRALDGGGIVLEERPRHDLAVVRVDVSRPEAGEWAWEGSPVHRAAVHSATSCMRVLTVAGGAVELRYRYETWVRLAGARPRPRVDLGGLAAELGRLEPAGARWLFDGAAALTPALRVEDGAPSALDPDAVVELACRRLADLDAGLPAWDPYGIPLRTA